MKVLDLFESDGSFNRKITKICAIKYEIFENLNSEVACE